MTNIERNFQKALSLYQSKGPFLPPKIAWKLDLILYMARGNIPNKDLLSVEQLMEYGDLQNLQPQSLKIIFNNIIDTLFNKETPKSKRCQIKKKGIFANWIQANIQFDKNNFLLLYSNKTYTFEKQEVSIKKSKQSKRIFDIHYKGSHKYSLKVKNEQEMKSIWHEWLKEIIQTKTQKNYQEMKTLMNATECTNFMDRINLFEGTINQRKSSAIPQRTEQFLQKTNNYNSYQNSFIIQNPLHHNSKQKKGSVKDLNSLKPVPHDFVCKLKGEKSILAVSKDEEARLYIEHVFSGKLQQKRILSFLLLQKSWNSFIIMESIQKTDAPNQIQIVRKYDTIKELGQFVQIQMKATYSSWNSNMSMITLDSQLNSESTNQIQCNCVITLESDSSKVRILIEEQLTSKTHSNEKLKKILIQMYKEIIKLELIHQKVVFRDFDAETIIVNMLEDEQSTNTTESQESIQYIDSQANEESFEKNTSNQFEETVEIIPKSKILQPSCDQILKLRSPQQIPNPQYIAMVRNRQYQKNYYNYRFHQERLTKYDDYIPHYRIDKLIENKIYEITPSRQLKFLDPQLLESQKDIFRFVLRQIGGNLLTGKSILNVSLPVAVFEPRSALERYAAELGCAPDYLIPRAQSPPLEQIKYITGMLMNIVCCELLMQKPFNAILGQTFQCYIKGIPVYYQQISHHPPVSAYYMKCQQFTIYGKFIPFIDISLNTGVGGNLGAVNIVFKNGSHFECYFPPSQISGFLYGDRKFRCYNRGYIFQKKHRLYSQFSIQNQKKGVYESATKLKGGQIIGGIFRVKQQFIQEIEKYRGHYKNLKKFGGITKEMIEQKYHKVSGQWFGKIMIDNTVINENINVYPVEYGKNILPSDSNHRLDLLYLRMKDLSRSQKEKELLEVMQRNDRKLREKYYGGGK